MAHQDAVSVCMLHIIQWLKPDVPLHVAKPAVLTSRGPEAEPRANFNVCCPQSPMQRPQFQVQGSSNLCCLQVETASMQLEAKDRTIAALQQMHTAQVERLTVRAEQLEEALGAARASTELGRYDDEDVPDVDRAQAAAAAAAMQQREDAIQLPSPRWEGINGNGTQLLCRMWSACECFVRQAGNCAACTRRWILHCQCARLRAG